MIRRKDVIEVKVVAYRIRTVRATLLERIANKTTALDQLAVPIW